MTVEQENQRLKEENCALKAKLDDADRRRVSAEKDVSRLLNEIQEKNEQIKLLEGQIEAYQYCLNSRFLR